jgi:hypothetical protein
LEIEKQRGHLQGVRARRRKQGPLDTELSFQEGMTLLSEAAVAGKLAAQSFLQVGWLFSRNKGPIEWYMQGIARTVSWIC